MTAEGYSVLAGGADAPNGTTRPADVAPAEYDFCSRCREHAGFTKDEETGEWLSECCARYPLPLGD